MPVIALAEGKRPSPLNPATARRRTTFGSLRTRNFRLFAIGQVFSNTGTWMQRIAQNWLVLSLTGSPAAVGLTIALQFLPTILLGMAAGLIADRYPKRRILLTTQVGMGSMAGLLAGLTLSGGVRAWQVELIAVGLGMVTAIDNPARQAFVNEMVGPDHLRNAISLNSSVFQLGALIGPAVSGLLISAFGPGWSFLINAVSFAAPLIALIRIRDDELCAPPPVSAQCGQMRAAVRYAASRADVLWPTILVGVFGMFTANLPVTLSAYAKSVFHSGPGGYGWLSATVAVGSLSGALISARRPRPRLRTLMLFAGQLSTLYLIAAAAPSEPVFCALLLAIGASTLLLLTSANSTVQLAAHDSIRGRIMGVYMLVLIGSAALGGPVLGSIDQHLGPRAGMLLAGALPGAASLLIAARLTVICAARVGRRSEGTSSDSTLRVPTSRGSRRRSDAMHRRAVVGGRP